MLSIDRFEGDFAVCEDDSGKTVTLRRELWPVGAREGDILVPDDGAYLIDTAETARRRTVARSRLARLTAESRRTAILREIAESAEPISASTLAERFHVSRQAIVGDIALLRAAGEPVVATPRGYLPVREPEGLVRTIACRHRGDQIAQELYAVVDQGGSVLDVIVEHPVYGQISGQLQVHSRYDADRFVQALAASDASPLSLLTGGIHLHTLRCPGEAEFGRILDALREIGVLLEDE